MSEEPFSDEEWDAYFAGVSENEDEQCERLKWGWHPGTGEAEVWEVGGPGDGLPSHSEHLAEAWGREVTISGGDVLGSAYVPKSAVEGERPRIYLQVYYAQEVPTKVLDWFSRSYSDGEITVTTHP